MCLFCVLYNRQTDSVDFLIDVERIDVGHAADIINYRHDALLQILVLYIILAAYPAQELLGVETRWVYGCFDEYLHQSCHDLITRKFDVEYRLALVNLRVGDLFTFLVCLFLALGNMVDETASKFRQGFPPRAPGRLPHIRSPVCR